MGNQGFSQRGSSLALHLLVHERNKAALLVSLSTQHTRVPTSTYAIGNPVKGHHLSRNLT